MNEARYIQGAYILRDENGRFTLGYGKKWWIVTTYNKTYIDGRQAGKSMEIGKEEFDSLLYEQKVLWGTTDWKGDFVPGIMRRELECSNCA